MFHAAMVCVNERPPNSWKKYYRVEEEMCCFEFFLKSSHLRRVQVFQLMEREDGKAR